MEDIGLVLEGGGMRGLYTSGVLDFFMEKNLYFPYVIGVSMGACNGASYISRQKGRNKRINLKYINDPRYLSYRNLVRRKGLFSTDFAYDEVPNKLEIFDIKTFNEAKEKFIIGTTDCDNGKPVYFEKTDCCDSILDIIRASSSLPFLAPIVRHKGLNLLDGGVIDPVPVKKSIEDGNNKNVIILTRNKGYMKKPFKMSFLAKTIYPKYKGLVEAMVNRYRIYNETIKYIEELEKEGKVFIIRPSELLEVKRIEKDTKKLLNLYNQGYEEAKQCYDKLKKWVSQ
jgi:Predicted esterase of the alpha-beta hydrolase superfamily